VGLLLAKLEIYKVFERPGGRWDDNIEIDIN
jgi:hypothetical protein